MDCRGDRPIPKWPLPVYMIDDAGTENGQPELATDVTSEDQDMLGSLMRHLLPTPAVSPPRATPIPSEHNQLIQRLLGKDHPVNRYCRSILVSHGDSSAKFASGWVSSDGAATADGTPQ